MRLKVKILSTLIYYDIPHLFTARDSVGTTYLCLLVIDDDEQSQYLVISISIDRLTKLIKGELALRDVFEHPEMGNWFVTEEFEDQFVYLTVPEFTTPTEDMLPAPGFTLPFVDEQEQTIIAEALERDNTIVHLSLSDPYDRSGIEANFLGDFVKLFQGLVKNAYKKSLNTLKQKDRKVLDLDYNWKMRAFAATTGSLNIHFAGTAQKDIFGNTNLERALEKIDLITSDFMNEEEYISLLVANRGYTISSLRNMMQKITEEHIKIKYQWYSPGTEYVRRREIGPAFADRILSVLNQREDLGQEIREFQGIFDSADVPRGTWRILNAEDAKHYSGTGEYSQLSGIVLDSQVYRVICEELVTVNKVTGNEEVSYSLLSVEVVG